MARCSCGCATLPTVTNAEQACGCGCDCCAPAQLSPEEEVQHEQLRDWAEKRLAELKNQYGSGPRRGPRTSVPATPSRRPTSRHWPVSTTALQSGGRPGTRTVRKLTFLSMEGLRWVRRC